MKTARCKIAHVGGHLLLVILDPGASSSGSFITGAAMLAGCCEGLQAGIGYHLGLTPSSIQQAVPFLEGPCYKSLGSC